MKFNARRYPHTEAVADCPHCNARFLAEWALEVLGPKPDTPPPPGPADPPRPAKQTQWTEHPALTAYGENLLTRMEVATVNLSFVKATPRQALKLLREARSELARLYGTR